MKFSLAIRILALGVVTLFALSANLLAQAEKSPPPDVEVHYGTLKGPIQNPSTLSLLNPFETYAPLAQEVFLRLDDLGNRYSYPPPRLRHPSRSGTDPMKQVRNLFFDFDMEAQQDLRVCEDLFWILEEEKNGVTTELKWMLVKDKQHTCLTQAVKVLSAMHAKGTDNPIYYAWLTEEVLRENPRWVQQMISTKAGPVQAAVLASVVLHHNIPGMGVAIVKAVNKRNWEPWQVLPVRVGCFQHTWEPAFVGYISHFRDDIASTRKLRRAAQKIEISLNQVVDQVSEDDRETMTQVRNELVSEMETWFP